MSKLDATIRAVRAAGFGGKDGKALPVQVMIGFVEVDSLPAAVAHGFTSIMPWTTTSRDMKQFANPGTPGVPCGAVHETPSACAAPTLDVPAVAHGFTPFMSTTQASPGNPEVPFGSAAAASADADFEAFEVEEPADTILHVVRGGRACYKGKGKVDGQGRVPVLRGGRAGYEGKGKPNSKGRMDSDRSCRVTVRRGGRPGYHGNGKSKPNASAAVATAVAATTATAVDSFMTG
jgi:hypothetical protein